MRVLIIAPAEVSLPKEHAPIKNMIRRVFFLQHLTVSYLAGLVPPHIEVRIVDEAWEPVTFDTDADLVAITSKTPFVEHAYQMADSYRKQGVPVVLGGYHVSLLPQEASRHADAVVVGEAESAWPRLLKDFEKGQMKSMYHGEPSDLKNLPLPRRDLLKTGYIANSLFATRGCPHHCSFCVVRKVYGRYFRARPVKEVITELAQLKGRIFFADDNMMANREYALQLFEQMVPLKKRWGTQVSGNFLEDDELLNKAVRAGMRFVFLGIESCNQESLDEAKKSFYPVKYYRRLIKKLNKYGVNVTAGIIFGFDHDGPQIFEETLKLLNDIEVSSAAFKILTPFPSTPLFQKLTREGRLLTTRWRYFNGHFVTFQPAKMGISELYDGFEHVRSSFYRTRPMLNRFLHFGYQNSDYFLAFNVGLGHDPELMHYQQMRDELMREAEERNHQIKEAQSIRQHSLIKSTSSI